MKITRLPYKLMFIFIAFYVLLVVPYTLIMSHDSDRMISKIDELSPLTPEQKVLYIKYKDDLSDNMMFVSFYTFILAFLISLFFSRSLLAPARHLYKGISSIKEGRFGEKLDIVANDELGDLMRTFNEMAEVLKWHHVELMRGRQYINAMLDPIWVIDDDGMIKDINPAFSMLFGYSRDDVVGSSIFDFIEEGYDKQLRRRALESGTSDSSQQKLNMISKSAGLIPVLLSFAQVHEGGEAVGHVGIIKDYRKELALIEALTEEKEHTEAIMDSMSDQVMVIDRDYKVIKANQALRVNMGRDVAGEACSKLLHGSEELCFHHGEVCPVKIVFETGKPFRTVHEHLGQDARDIFYDISAFPIRDTYGEVRYVAKSMRDITDRIHFEETIDHKNRELTAMNIISKVLSQSLKSEEIYSEILSRICGLFGMDGGGIYLLDDMGKALRRKYTRGLSDEFVKSIDQVPVGRDLPGRVAASGASLVIGDISADRRAEGSLFSHTGVKSFACVPIRGKEKLLGVFFIFSFQRREFDSEEEGILNSISEMMGISFENIRLYERMRALYEQDKQRRVEEQSDLLKLSTMLASTLDMDKVLASSLALVKASCWADLAVMFEIDESGGMRVKATSDQGRLNKGSVIYARGVQSLEAVAIERREPLIALGIAKGTKYHLDERLSDFSSACCIPIYIGDRTLGAFTLYYVGDANVADEEVHFLRTVSSVLSVAMERARLYENVIIQRGMADTILDSIVDGVATMDMSGQIIAMNRAAGNVFGVSPERAPGMKMDSLVGASSDNLQFGMKMQECLSEAQAGRQTNTDTTFVQPRGQRLPLTITSAPVYNNHGEIVGVVYVLRDMSMEREVDMLKTDFVRSVSHEFRTPLTAIVGMTEMVLDGDIDSGRARQYLSTVLSEAKRLSNMVSDVLDVAKIESGNIDFFEDDVDFRRVLDDIRAMFAQGIESERIKYAESMTGDLSGYRADVEKLKQLLRNLVENSVNYSDPGVEIKVGVEREGESVIISVQDTGWGISAEDVTHLGERFYRGAWSEKKKGTGLGMSLCKEIARMHGGRLQVKSKLGKGTTVRVVLPMRRG